MSNLTPISEHTWLELVAALRAGWAQSGIFHTGVGNNYQPGQLGSLLCVGTCAGPRGKRVGSGYDRLASAEASKKWMSDINRNNPTSAFWQFFRQIDRTCQAIAWTNVCKMDRVNGKNPLPREFSDVAAICMAALEEEIEALAPHVTVFATSDSYGDHVRKLLFELGYQGERRFDEQTTWSARPAKGQFVIMTKHPQGWRVEKRQRVVDLMKALLNSRDIPK
jgi:hypothetical protein